MEAAEIHWFKEMQGEKSNLPLQLYCGYWFHILLRNSFLLLATSFSLVWKCSILQKVKIKGSIIDDQCN